MTNYSQLVCGWMMAGRGSTRLRFGGPNDPYDSHRGNDSSTFDLYKKLSETRHPYGFDFD